MDDGRVNFQWLHRHSGKDPKRSDLSYRVIILTRLTNSGLAPVAEGEQAVPYVRLHGQRLARPRKFSVSQALLVILAAASPVRSGRRPAGARASPYDLHTVSTQPPSGC
jgi:hypothetical protein